MVDWGTGHSGRWEEGHRRIGSGAAARESMDPSDKAMLLDESTERLREAAAHGSLPPHLTAMTV